MGTDELTEGNASFSQFWRRVWPRSSGWLIVRIRFFFYDLERYVLIDPCCCRGQDRSDGLCGSSLFSDNSTQVFFGDAQFQYRPGLPVSLGDFYRFRVIDQGLGKVLNQFSQRDSLRAMLSPVQVAHPLIRGTSSCPESKRATESRYSSNSIGGRCSAVRALP